MSSSASPQKKRTLVAEFIRFSKKTTLSQLFLYGLLLLELFLFILFFSFWLHAFVLTLLVSLIFSTLFGAFIFRLFRDAKLPEKCLALATELKSEFGDAREEAAHALAKSAMLLQGKENKVYKLPRYLHFLHSSIRRLSGKLHHYDFYKMKETLLLVSIEELLSLIKEDPLSLKLHASLANAYVMLAGLYRSPHEGSGNSKLKSAMEEKFKEASYLAVEEFKILKAFAPDDPWIHEQLAMSYHDLNMPKEEIEEYEHLRRVKPKNEEALLRLGKLYFSQGESAKALALYQLLRDLDPLKADALIQSYGSFSLYENPSI